MKGSSADLEKMLGLVSLETKATAARWRPMFRRGLIGYRGRDGTRASSLRWVLRGCWMGLRSPWSVRLLGYWE